MQGFQIPPSSKSLPSVSSYTCWQAAYSPGFELKPPGRRGGFLGRSTVRFSTAWRNDVHPRNLTNWYQTWLHCHLLKSPVTFSKKNLSFWGPPCDSFRECNANRLVLWKKWLYSKPAANTLSCPLATCKAPNAKKNDMFPHDTFVNLNSAIWNAYFNEKLWIPPIIMEVENGVLEDVFSLQMGYSPLPWLWEEGYHFLAFLGGIPPQKGIRFWKELTHPLTIAPDLATFDFSHRVEKAISQALFHAWTMCIGRCHPDRKSRGWTPRGPAVAMNHAMDASNRRKILPFFTTSHLFPFKSLNIWIWIRGEGDQKKSFLAQLAQLFHHSVPKKHLLRYTVHLTVTR